MQAWFELKNSAEIRDGNLIGTGLKKLFEKCAYKFNRILSVNNNTKLLQK